MTSDELETEGRRLHNLGNFVFFLYPSQEWMAVETQMPFLRYEPIPTGPDLDHRPHPHNPPDKPFTRRIGK